MGHGICYTETGVSDELQGEEMRRKIPTDRAGNLDKQPVCRYNKISRITRIGAGIEVIRYGKRPEKCGSHHV